MLRAAAEWTAAASGAAVNKLGQQAAACCPAEPGALESAKPNQQNRYMAHVQDLHGRRRRGVAARAAQCVHEGRRVYTTRAYGHVCPPPQYHEL